MKTLVVFDFDDTLFESESQIAVKSPSGGTKYLTSGEYASYKPSADDELDFSQFESYPPRPKPIMKSISRLKYAVSYHGIENVIILTARGKSLPVYEVLRDFDLPRVFVAAVGSSDPAMKANYVTKTIEDEGYLSVIVFEDNIRNIAAIKSAVIPMLGSKNFKAYNVMQGDDGHVLVKH